MQEFPTRRMERKQTTSVYTTMKKAHYPLTQTENKENKQGQNLPEERKANDDVFTTTKGALTPHAKQKKKIIYKTRTIQSDHQVAHQGGRGQTTKVCDQLTGGSENEAVICFAHNMMSIVSEKSQITRPNTNKRRQSKAAGSGDQKESVVGEEGDEGTTHHSIYPNC